MLEYSRFTVGVQSLFGLSTVTLWLKYSPFMVGVEKMSSSMSIYIYTVVSVFDS